MAKIITTKKYTGTVKKLALSLIPRRFMNIISSTIIIAIGIEKRYKAGTADVIASTPEVVETATVNM